jgi:hypothetical protein
VGRRSSGRSDSALSSFFHLPVPAKGRAEPAHTRRPPPHSASPCGPASLRTPACIFLPPYAFRCSFHQTTAEPPPASAAAPPFHLLACASARSQPPARALVTSCLSRSQLRDRVIASSHAPFLPPADDNDDKLIESAGSRGSEPRWSVCRDFVIPPCWQDGVCVRALGVAICSLLDA